MLPLQPLVKNFFTAFHENPTNNVVADTESQTDGRRPSPHKRFFLGHFAESWKARIIFVMSVLPHE